MVLTTNIRYLRIDWPEKNGPRMQLDVIRRRALTPEIEEFTLAPRNAARLPAAEAGAHITLRTPSGAMRRYSLVHPDPEPENYTIAVKRETPSRGGSASMIDAAAPGTALMAEPPVNDFALAPQGPALLIAGGLAGVLFLSLGIMRPLADLRSDAARKASAARDGYELTAAAAAVSGGSEASAPQAAATRAGNSPRGSRWRKARNWRRPSPPG